MAGQSDKPDGLDAAIAHCEQALACLDSAGLFGEGANLSFALDRLRDFRDQRRAAQTEASAPEFGRDPDR